MWSYDKKLIYPVKIKRSDPAAAMIIISQLGGPHGELGAATRYLSQRYSMPYGEVTGILTDVGTKGSKCTRFENPFHAKRGRNTVCGAEN